jgi:hypothetical protein
VVNNVKADQGNLNAEWGVFGHTPGVAQLPGPFDASAGAPVEYASTVGPTASAAVPNVAGAVISATRVSDGGVGAVGIALGLNMNCIALDINDANNNSSFAIYARHVKGDSAYAVDSDIENQIFFDNDPNAYVNQAVLTAPVQGPANPLVPVNDPAAQGYLLVP